MEKARGRVRNAMVTAAATIRVDLAVEGLIEVVA
jgi:hypothetical protein